MKWLLSQTRLDRSVTWPKYRPETTLMRSSLPEARTDPCYLQGRKGGEPHAAGIAGAPGVPGPPSLPVAAASQC